MKKQFNVPKKHKLRVWCNIYPGDNQRPWCHLSKESADKVAASDRVACVAVDLEYEEGQGL